MCGKSTPGKPASQRNGVYCNKYAIRARFEAKNILSAVLYPVDQNSLLSLLTFLVDQKWKFLYTLENYAPLAERRKLRSRRPS
jgi:hypothetical protein